MAAVADNPQSPVPLDTIPISPGAEDDEATATKTATFDPDQIRTVFDDPQNFNVKHPLANTWTLWFTKPPSGKVGAHRLLEMQPDDKLMQNRVTIGTICSKKSLASTLWRSFGASM